MRLSVGCCAAIALWAAQAVAQTVPTSTQLDVFAQEIPAQNWYPEGYYDLKVAAAAEQIDYTAQRDEQLAEWAAESAAIAAAEGTDAESYGEAGLDLIDCGWSDLGWTGDELEDSYILLANDVARIRLDLLKQGFPLNMIDTPMLDYERRGLEIIGRQASGEELPLVVVQFKDWEAQEVDAETANYYTLATTLEALRMAQDSSLPEVTVDGGCGDGSQPVRFKTSPPSGRIWLISTFAFNVCTRRMPDPWNPIACRWNEIEAGQEDYWQGRYIYRVRWPNGREIRGAREIFPEFPNDEEVTTITLGN